MRLSHRSLTLAVVALSLTGCSMVVVPGHAAVVGHMVTPEPVTRQRILRDVPGPEQARWLAYLDASEKQMAADKAALAAERAAAGGTLPMEPPSGHNARSLPLDRDAAFYGSPEAAQLATNLLSYQTPAGGWSKNLNFGAGPRLKGQGFGGDVGYHTPIPAEYAEPLTDWAYIGTLDNDATTTEIRFLIRVAAATQSAEERRRDEAGALRGIEYLLRSQFPNGGWPQVWPLEGGYHDAITFNDDAVVQAMEVLSAAASGRRDDSFVPLSVRDRARQAVQRGIGAILRTQIRVGDRLTVWCQQHDALTLVPVGARNYEMAALSSSESASLVDFLMELPDPSPEVRRAVYAATNWLATHEIHDVVYRGGRETPGGRQLFPQPGAPPLWARFYSIETGKPLFGDRDRTIHDTLSEISLERRNGYGWYNSAASETLQRFAAWSRAHPA